MGISVPGPAELNMADLVGWKENIVTRLNKGVEHLLKNAGAELITGWAEEARDHRLKLDEASIAEAKAKKSAPKSNPSPAPFARPLQNRGALKPVIPPPALVPDAPDGGECGEE